MKSAIVTGATGYIGSRLTRRLLSAGWRVGIITRPQSKTDYIEDIYDQVHVITFDGSVQSLTRALSQRTYEVVFHLAGHITNQTGEDMISELIQSNIEFSTLLLQAMKTAGVHRLVNTGTYWQNYNDQPYSPVNVYAATKEAFLTMAQYYLETSALQMVTLKLFDVYGPGDKRAKLITSLDQHAEANPLKLSLGQQEIDYVYIDDVIRAYVCAYELLLRTEKKMQTFGVCTGKRHTLKQVIEICESVLGKRIPVEYGAKAYRPREVMRPWTTYQTLPGWRAEIELKEGLGLCYKMSASEHEKE